MTHTTGNELGNLLSRRLTGSFGLSTRHREPWTTHDSYVAKTPADRFVVARALLVAYRNRNEHKCRSLLHAVPHIQLDLKNYPDSGEDIIFHELDKCYAEKLKKDVDTHQRNLAKRESGSSKANVAKSMRRLQPPGGKKKSGLDCIWDEERLPTPGVVTGGKKIVEVVNRHWRKTFERKFRPDTGKMREWLSAFPRKFTDPNIETWTPSEEDVENAISHCDHSAPGPDGIPFEAFKAVPKLAAAVIHKVIAAMITDPNFDAPEYFNRAWLALLPKKPFAVDPVHGDVYNAENLRPLSVVGCFNRIIASAFRFMLVNKMDQVVGKEQRGFMKGRHRKCPGN